MFDRYGGAEKSTWNSETKMNLWTCDGDKRKLIKSAAGCGPHKSRDL
jgi:hypothetical protein